MLRHISFSPGFFPNIRAGVVFGTSAWEDPTKDGATHFGIIQGLEEGRDSDQTVVVIPHHRLSLFLMRHLEGVLED